MSNIEAARALRWMEQYEQSAKNNRFAAIISQVRGSNRAVMVPGEARR